MSNDPFFQGGDHFSGTALMEAAGLSCTLHMPRARASRFGAGGEELAQSLPEANARASFLVDRYPGAPEDWLRSGGITMSYMVPVVVGHGLWLDFNGNLRHTHDVATVISAQGVNATTGLKADPLRLEQYRTKCPKHDVPFEGERHCPRCGFNWPAQNYLASAVTPSPY